MPVYPFRVWCQEPSDVKVDKETYCIPRLHCGRKCFSIHALQKCNSCHQVLYCSKDCQRRDWKRYKLACQAFKKNQFQISCFSCRTYSGKVFRVRFIQYST